MNKKTIVSLLLVGMLVFSAGIASYAWFTSEMESKDYKLEAGTLKLRVNESTDQVSDNFEIDLNTENLQPGDILTKGEEGYATITVKNTGSLPMATFGRFTLKQDNGFGEAIKITDYKVDFYDSKGNKKEFYNKTKNKWYERTDEFIKDGEAVAGMATNMREWVDGDGPMDFMNVNAPWDYEGLKPGEKYVITFRLQYDKEAKKQDVTANLGYEVKATQVNEEAILDLNLKNVPENYITGEGWGAYDTICTYVGIGTPEREQQ